MLFLVCPNQVHRTWVGGRLIVTSNKREQVARAGESGKDWDPVSGLKLVQGMAGMESVN